MQAVHFGITQFNLDAKHGAMIISMIKFHACSSLALFSHIISNLIHANTQLPVPKWHSYQTHFCFLLIQMTDSRCYCNASTLLQLNPNLRHKGSGENWVCFQMCWIVITCLMPNEFWSGIWSPSVIYQWLLYQIPWEGSIPYNQLDTDSLILQMHLNFIGIYVLVPSCIWW